MTLLKIIIEENFKKRDVYSNAINESLNNIRNL